MRNLIVRTLTGAVYVLLLVGCTVYSPVSAFFFFAAVAAATLWEFGSLMNTHLGAAMPRPINAMAGVVLAAAVWLSAIASPQTAQMFALYGLLMLYIILFTRVLRIVIKQPVTFGSFMAFGLGFLIIMQAMINMGVSIGLLPVTGQPLPFVSMGGTSMLATGIILGIILSVTRSMEDEANSQLETITEEETTTPQITEE